MSGARWLILGLALVLVVGSVSQCAARASGAAETMDGITVRGPDDFRARTRDALDTLPVEWHTFVTRWLNTVTYDDGLTRRNALSYVDVLSATFHVNKRTAFGYDEHGYAGNSIIWYACGLVHEAQHVYQFKHSKLKYGREAEFDAIGAQAACLRRLSAPPTIQDYVDELRECIHADGCKYWKQHRG